MNIQQLLDQARERIAVTKEELTEARRRRGLVAEALRAEFGGRVYFNGSLAHGDANDPLADFDIGVVVRNPAGLYGPGAKSALDLQERARDAIRAALADEFPDLRVEVAGRKRSVLVRFSDPVSDRADDFTGDVIVALDHEDEGLWIPRYDTWDRSHPEKHTDLILDANESTSSTLARTSRLLKHWSKRHDSPLCSWHIKALLLDAVTSPMALIDALEAFFETAYEALGDGDTPDPANVGPDIKARVSRSHARDRLSAALGLVRDAKQAEADGRPVLAQAKLAEVLPDIVDKPTAQELADEDRAVELARLRRAGNLAGVGAGATTALPSTRGWGHG